MKFDFSNIHLFEWEELYYTEIENEIGLSAFRILNKNQEEALIETKKEFNRRIKVDLDMLDVDDRANYYAQIFEREELAIREMQRQQRYSLCLSLFSFFEGRLKTICTALEKEFDFKLRISDLNADDDLMRYWNYLEKVYEMDMTELIPFFTPIRQNKLVRNIIAHRGGNASNEQFERIKKIKGITYIKNDIYFQIHIDENNYINYLVEKMDNFLNCMLLSIDKRYKVL